MPKSSRPYLITLTPMCGTVPVDSCEAATVADVLDVLDRTIGRACYCPLDCWQGLLASGGHALTIAGLCYITVTRIHA